MYIFIDELLHNITRMDIYHNESSQCEPGKDGERFTDKISQAIKLLHLQCKISLLLLASLEEYYRATRLVTIASASEL